MAAVKQQNNGVDYEVSTEGLAEAYRDVRAVRDGLKRLPGDPPEREKEGWEKLTRFTKHHLTTEANGSAVDMDGVYKTLRLAQSVRKDMEERFDTLIKGCIGSWNSIIKEIYEAEPSVLDASDELVELQDEFRKVYSDDDSSYVDVAKAALEVRRCLAGLEREAKESLESRRQEKRRKNKISKARKLLEELELV